MFSIYLVVVVVPGCILVDFGFLVVAGRAVLCVSEFTGTLALAPVMIRGPLLTPEMSMFSVSESDFRSISWLCSYIETVSVQPLQCSAY